MKLECSLDKLKEAINKAEKITGKTSTLESIRSILFIASGKSLKVRATNLSLGLEIEIPAKIEVCCSNF
jgi:DNA polymerase-3 subunit beta